MEENFKIELANGKEITGKINGNNYITTESVSESDLSDINLIGATVDGSPMGLNMTCCNFWQADDGIHMIFREKSAQELETEALNARLEYLAMMADIDLDD